MVLTVPSRVRRSDLSPQPTIRMNKVEGVNYKLAIQEYTQLRIDEVYVGEIELKSLNYFREGLNEFDLKTLFM